MARIDESKAAISALNKHSSVVDSACYEQGGVVPFTESNNSTIDALTKHRLAYLVDDEYGVQIHSSVKKLLDRVTSRTRFRERHGEFHSQISNLEYAIDSYRRSQMKASNRNHQYLSEIREIVIELNDALMEAVASFHKVVADEFSVITDIDEKIRQIGRCKKEIENINNVFAHLTVKQIREWVQTDIDLEHILLRILKSSIDSALKDLASANRKLVEMLAKLQSDKKASRLNSLIDVFSACYEEEQGYQPSIEYIEVLPECFSITKNMEMRAYGNVDSERNTEMLSKLAIAALSNADAKSRDKTQPLDKIEVEDVRSKEEQRGLDEVDEGLEMLFEAIKDENITAPISAVDSLDKLGIDISVEDWLLLVDGYYSAQKDILSSLIEVHEERSIELPYDGNIFVSDIVFRKRAVA